MTCHEETVREFLETWQRRRSGALPPVDLRVSCSSCGVLIVGDARVEFDKAGLMCESCFKKGKDESPSN
jgi:hypothetical protein